MALKSCQHKLLYGVIWGKLFQQPHLCMFTIFQFKALTEFKNQLLLY